MKQTQYYIPTTKQTPADAQIISHQILLQGGYVNQTAAGIYSYLPLGLKVLQKIETIIREEFNRVGAIEILMPVLQPEEFWQQSGRFEAYGPDLMRMNDRHERTFALGPTHEEVITMLVRDHVKSYKQLPFTLYQIQTKFRDELRPRFGLMRGREFLMLDAYSFSSTQSELDQAYDEMASAYNAVFQRLAFNYRQVDALSGEIGGSESAEFMVLSEVGEDTIIYSDTSNFASNIEVFPDIKEGDASPDGQGQIRFAKGIEIGHIFKLGTKYSESLKANFTNSEGKQEPIIMGCYGIGVSRIIMALIEQNQINEKLVWPIIVAPFTVHILIANLKDQKQNETAKTIYENLKNHGVDVLLDDRNERIGVKFGDADLIGAPLRIVVGKGVERGVVEYQNRLTDTVATDIELTAICDKIRNEL